MISTQLDLFGGPPKPPKNIREEEPPVVAPQADEKVSEPVNEPESEISEVSSGEPELDVEHELLHEEMPEWIDEPVMESDAERDEEPAYEPYPDRIDDSKNEYVPEIEEETEDDPGDAESTYTEPTPDIEDETDFEPDSDAGDSTFDEPTQEIEETEPTSVPDAIEEYETPLEVEDVQEKEKDAEENLAAPLPEDRVHVQLPSHEISPLIFTGLIPVEGFVVDEDETEDAEDLQPDGNDELNENDNDSAELESDSNALDMQDEEPPSSPFLVEAITSNDIIIGGETAVDLGDVNAENTPEIKEGQLQIPDDEKLFLRQYYTMRETSNMFGVNQSLLRYWENEFDVLKPKKNRKGDRYFRPEDIKNLELIYHLLKVRKFTIEGAREYIKSKKKALDTFELVQRLEKLKLFLHELKTHL